MVPCMASVFGITCPIWIVQYLFDLATGVFSIVPSCASLFFCRAINGCSTHTTRTRGSESPFTGDLCQYYSGSISD